MPLVVPFPAGEGDAVLKVDGLVVVLLVSYSVPLVELVDGDQVALNQVGETLGDQVVLVEFEPLVGNSYSVVLGEAVELPPVVSLPCRSRSMASAREFILTLVPATKSKATMSKATGRTMALMDRSTIPFSVFWAAIFK